MHVWLYYAKAGGGHQGPAEALAKVLRGKLSVEQVHLEDIAAGSAWKSALIEKGYAWLVHRAAWLYILLYELNRWRLVQWLEQTLAVWIFTKKIVRSFTKQSPDLIITTYFLVQPLIRAQQIVGTKAPIVVVVTDPFSASDLWFYSKEVNYIVASTAVQQQALRCGVPAEQVTILPQVIRESSPVTSERMSQRKVLLVGGANGLPKAEQVVKALLQSTISMQLTVVCGTNEHLRKKIEALSQQYGKVVEVYGYVDFLPRLLAEASVVLTKAGANMLREIMLAKKPIIMTHYIWGQEKGNVAFVETCGVGHYEPQATKIPALVQAYLEDPAEQQRVRLAYSQLKLENGTKAAVDVALSLVPSWGG